MAGLLLLAAAIIWFIVCLTFSKFVSKWLPSFFGKKLFTSLMTLILIVIPFTNQIIDSFKFDSYCKESENITILGNIAAPRELYNSAGEWRLGTYSQIYNLAESNESNLLVRLADSLVRWGGEGYVLLPGSNYLAKRKTIIYERSSDRPVAEWTSYAYTGGLPGLMGGMKECRPKVMRESGYGMYKQIFSYQK